MVCQSQKGEIICLLDVMIYLKKKIKVKLIEFFNQTKQQIMFKINSVLQKI